MFIKGKIHKMLAEYPHRAELKRESEEIRTLKDNLERVYNDQQNLFRLHHEEDLAFVMKLSKKYDEEVKKQKSSKMRQDIMYLGRWQYIKDWVSLRLNSTPEIDALHLRLNKDVF